eukprot:TRINITY_DN2477_c0_g1_i1.p1 TRINITY_DN2477_c0_g1~~TRINITY_DN2477_c0_g1_i1.p1  ORF type:complete len:663 (-),score=150.28 TRINITY_DN2477_c0_g1_i1:90-2078(-)
MSESSKRGIDHDHDATGDDAGRNLDKRIKTEEKPEDEERDLQTSDENDNGEPSSSSSSSSKKPRSLAFEKLYMDQLPNSDMYEQSLMHRDTVTHIGVSVTDFIITGSVDGHIKFWKKLPEGIEFVKHFRAHLGAVCGLTISPDGLLLCSIAADQSMKIYDVLTFDMINMFKLPYIPSACTWIHKRGSARPIVAVADRATSIVRLYDPSSDQGEPMHSFTKLHRTPVRLMAYNEPYDTVVSIDTSGLIEYWSPDPSRDYRVDEAMINFKMKTETDLYEFAKLKTTPVSLCFSKDGSLFATMGKDKQVRVFHFGSGKLYRKYDESLLVSSKLQKAEDKPSEDGGPPSVNMFRLDNIDFGRRMAVEREIDTAVTAGDTAAASNVIFDDSGKFILYPTLFGIKVVNLITNKVVKLLGHVENGTRFLSLALYQGVNKGDIVQDNKKKDALPDPTLFCSAYKKQRFYLFTRREPTEPDEGNPLETGRDVFNEKPKKEDTMQILGQQGSAGRLARSVVLHTTKGDIYIKLFGDECPKSVENFSTHSKNGYYNGLIFHRVIKGFMVQTGDPLGDGTGGTSIWGHDFEDEFKSNLRHDRPYTVSMANAGPNTNGSQFFITTVACTRLDNKHTVFGRVSKGMEVVLDIEKVKTDDTDKPLDDVKILSVKVEY